MDFSKASFNGHGHVAISLTDTCNKRCSYCYVGEEYLSRSKIIDISTLVSDLKRLYNEHHFRLVTILGGEPSLLCSLETILESIANIGFDIIIQTNGMLSTKRISRLRAYNIRAISYSLDSPNEDVNDRLRFPGSFQLVHKGVHFCLQEQISTRICSVVCHANKHDIINLYEWCNNVGVDVLNIHELDSSTNAALLNPAKLTATEWRGLVGSLTSYSQQGHSYTALRMPIAYLTVDESRLIAQYQLSCPALSNDMLYISPQREAYRCPLLMNKRPSYKRVSDAFRLEPLDMLQLSPKSARCPISHHNSTDNANLIDGCKLVKLTVNKPGVSSNTPVWSDILEHIHNELAHS